VRLSLLVLVFWTAHAAAVLPDLQQVRNALKANDVPKAERLLDGIIRRQPGNAEAYHLRGAIRLGQRRLDEAELALKKAVELNRRLAVAYVALADVYGLQSKAELEHQTLVTGLERAGSHPALLLRLGVIEARNGDLKSALARFQAIPAKEAPPGYWEALGRTHLSLGNYEAAETAYKHVLQQNPQAVATLRALSGIALKRGDKQKAWEYIAAARRAAPNSPEVLNEFAQVSIIANSTAEAVTALRLAVLMEPDDPQYILALGNALMENQNYREAIPVFQKYLQLKPGEAIGELMLGEALRGSGQNEEAKAHLEKAVALEPDRAEAYYQLGMVAFAATDDERAEELFRKALERQETHGPACLALGRLYLRWKENEKAVDWLVKAGSLVPADPNVPFQLSRAYAALGQRDKAQEALALYFKLNAEREKRDHERLQPRYASKRQGE